MSDSKWKDLAEYEAKLAAKKIAYIAAKKAAVAAAPKVAAAATVAAPIAGVVGGIAVLWWLNKKICDALGVEWDPFAPD
jgi:multidrug efflux pump subunit AcrA (membrane-fusion protein)